MTPEPSAKSSLIYFESHYSRAKFSAIAFDSARKKVAIFNKEYMAGRVYEAADIMSVEVYEDDRSISQASRTRQIGAAMVGNFIAGVWAL